MIYWKRHYKGRSKLDSLFLCKPNKVAVVHEACCSIDLYESTPSLGNIFCTEFTLEETMKAQRGSASIALLFL